MYSQAAAIAIAELLPTVRANRSRFMTYTNLGVWNSNPARVEHAIVLARLALPSLLFA